LKRLGLAEGTRRIVAGVLGFREKLSKALSCKTTEEQENNLLFSVLSCTFESFNSDSALLGIIVTTVREYGVYVLVFKVVFTLAGSEVSLTLTISEVLGAVIINTAILWVGTPRSFSCRYRCFEGTSCFHLQS
jgi:hypothetical protein